MGQGGRLRSSPRLCLACCRHVNQSKIRILTILEARSITGPAKAVLEFAREAAKAGAAPSIELSILTFLRGEPGNSFTSVIREKGIPLEIVSEKRVFDLGVISQLREIVARRKPDVIWTNGVKSHFLVRLAGLHRQAKWVAFHHGYTTTTWKTRLYNKLDRWSHHGAERLVTVCAKFAADIEAQGIPANRIRVEHMPVRPSEPAAAAELADLRRALDISEQTRVVLSVGRLSKEKGQDGLLRAFATVEAGPKRLLLLGDGPELEPLRALARELKIQSAVSFLGLQSDVRPYYELADVFVLPSHSEGSPNVLLEAMDAGVPVVATAVGGIPELATNELDALLVQDSDVAALANAINRLLRDEALRFRLTAAAQNVLALHTPEHYFQSIASVFEEVVGPPV